MEYLEIFDQEGRATGEKVDRATAHRLGIPHACVHLYWIDGDRILLQKRSADKELFPLRWDITVAGHITYRESPVEAIIREAREELGISLLSTNLQFLYKVYNEIREGDYIDREYGFCYLYRIPFDRHHIRLYTKEVCALKPVKIERFLRMVFRWKSLFYPHQEEYQKMKEFYMANRF